jgi:tyrosinase
MLNTILGREASGGSPEEPTTLARRVPLIPASVFALLGLAGPALGQTAVEIEVGAGGPADDYVCWGPVEARARLAAPQAQPLEVNITTTPHDPVQNSGELAFVDAPAGGLAAGQVTSAPEIEVELPADGSWRSFYVLGTAASSADKDVSIVVSDQGGAEIARHDLMVRIRKNAEKLTDAERDRFLNAFVNAANNNNQFDKYWRLHTTAANLAHQVAFVPWHRVFLINLERELQAEDPSVALPYWEFDKVAPNLFSEDFLGRVNLTPPTFNVVQFSITNPLSGWSLSDPSVTPLRRNRNGDTSVSLALNKNFMQNNQHGVMTAAIFGPYHGQAHVHIGGNVGNFFSSPSDPLFFLLHANVDRAWAAWERLYDRFDRTQGSAYDLQGSHSPGASQLFGNFVDDTMWPWDGLSRPTEPGTATTSVILPSNPGPSGGLTGKPEVGDTLDYLDMAGVGAAHGFCYDDMPYGVGTVGPFWP